jgi:hypothetical protein
MNAAPLLASGGLPSIFPAAVRRSLAYGLKIEDHR